MNAVTLDGDTALMAAALNGHVKLVRLLLNARADMNVTTADNSTTLLGAARVTWK